jgi:secreted trypsin-like serine protease
LVAAMVSLFVFVPSSEGAPAGDKPTYEPYIINGEPVPNGKYPFMAALIDPNLSPSPKLQDDLKCGGSLIDKTHVLTAGHCVFEGGDVGFDPGVNKYQVIVGRTVLTSNQGQVRSIEDIDVHPKYGGASDVTTAGRFKFDAAVIELSRPVKGIKPIELATSKQNNLERAGRHATIAGWGSIIPHNPCLEQVSEIPNRMQEAQVPILSDSRADKLAQEPLRCPGEAPIQDDVFFPKLMIGAGGVEKTGTCQGDSGGPLFVRTSGHDDNGKNGDDDNGGKYTQIGITSYTLGCGANNPDGFTEVNAKPILSFIERAADNGNGDDNGDNDNDK